ncbi:hypothetical protein HS7_01740 [Sulfolobales archaeon HS-7]|nr:hypothetical protein HS7_01740 [Sulfolobales archaeon HS-7]
MKEFDTMRIGKKGLTTEVLNEIKRRLREHTTVKIKFPKDTDRRKYASELASLTNSELVDLRGYVATLRRKRNEAL